MRRSRKPLTRYPRVRGFESLLLRQFFFPQHPAVHTRTDLHRASTRRASRAPCSAATFCHPPARISGAASRGTCTAARNAPVHVQRRKKCARACAAAQELRPCIAGATQRRNFLPPPGENLRGCIPGDVQRRGKRVGASPAPCRLAAAAPPAPSCLPAAPLSAKKADGPLLCFPALPVWWQQS